MEGETRLGYRNTTRFKKVDSGPGKELEQLRYRGLSRWYGFNSDSQVELHFFTDVPKSACGTLTQFKFETQKEHKSRFITRKSLLAPVKVSSNSRGSKVQGIICLSVELLKG